jgi:hypothetical protein
VGGIEALVFGMLIFVIGTLLIANAWAVVDAKVATSTAAREAARAYVESGHGPAEAAAAAEAAGMTALANLHRSSGASVDVSGDYRRCGRITARVATVVPYLHLPLVGGPHAGFTVTARHSELLDPYRSGLPGVAGCGSA